MTVIHILLAGLLLLSGVFSRGGDLSAAAARTAQEPAAPVEIPMELLANRPLIRVTVNGEGPFAFLIAPEEQRTLIDAELAEALKLRPARDGAPEIVADVGFGANQTVKIPIAVQDIARFTSELGRTTRLRGVISLSAWKDQLVTFDYSHWRVTLLPGSLPEPNGKDVFALNSSNELRLALSVAEQSLECRVDPLFPGGLVLPASSVGPLQTTGEPRDNGSIKTPEGIVRVREARLKTDVMLGPFELKTPLVLLAESGGTATVGSPWLARFSVTYDVANARVRLQRQAGSVTRR
ncbi:MAG: hypothetical protein ACRD1H_00995 [Vicinamibacterales bacterium]